MRIVNHRNHRLRPQHVSIFMQIAFLDLKGIAAAVNQRLPQMNIFIDISRMRDIGKRALKQLVLGITEKFTQGSIHRDVTSMKIADTHSHRGMIVNAAE